MGGKTGGTPKIHCSSPPKHGGGGEGMGVLLGGCGFARLLAHLPGPPRSQMRKRGSQGTRGWTDRERRGCTALPLCRRPGPAHRGPPAASQEAHPAQEAAAAGVCPTSPPEGAGFRHPQLTHGSHLYLYGHSTLSLEHEWGHEPADLAVTPCGGVSSSVWDPSAFENLWGAGNPSPDTSTFGHRLGAMFQGPSAAPILRPS